MSRDEFRRKLATSQGRAELGVELTVEEAALVLADDARLDLLFEAVEASLARPVARDARVNVSSAEEPTVLDSTPVAAATWWRRRAKLVAVGAAVLIFICGVVTSVVISTGNASDARPPASDASSVEGDLDGDGRLSGWEQDQLLNSSQEEDAPEASTSDTSSSVVADGYQETGSGLAWKYLDVNGESKPCGYLSNCVVIGVRATQACSGVYAEAQVLSSSGIVVGMANGTLPALSYGDTGRLKLGWVENDGAKAKLIRLSCL